LPEVSDEQITIDDFSEAENVFLNGSLKMLKLIRKPTGQRRSLKGLNRVVQIHQPEMGWRIHEVMCVVEAWRIVGLNSLADSLRAARRLKQHSVRTTTVRPQLIKSVSRKVENAGSHEVFVSTDSILKKAPGDPLSWNTYKIFAVTNYGQYRFHLLSFEPPSTSDIQDFCIAHNFVAEKN